MLANCQQVISELKAISIIKLWADMVAIVISIVSNSYYGMPMRQIDMHPIISFSTIEIKMAAVSAKNLLHR